MGRIAMLCDFQHISPWNINARMDTTETHDTPIGPLSNQRGPVFKGWTFYFFSDELLMVDSKFIGAVLELTLSTSIADRTVQRMIDQQEFQGFNPHPFHAFCVGMNHHSIDHKRCTRGHGHFHTLTIHQTDPAGFDQAQSFMITKGRDIDPILFSDFQNGLIWPRSKLFSINRQLQHAVFYPPFTPTPCTT
jgi:hypothetical protein